MKIILHTDNVNSSPGLHIRMLPVPEFLSYRGHNAIAPCGISNVVNRVLILIRPFHPKRGRESKRKREIDLI